MEPIKTTVTAVATEATASAVKVLQYKVVLDAAILTAWAMHQQVLLVAPDISAAEQHTHVTTAT
jgi:hypothetical protein